MGPLGLLDQLRDFPFRDVAEVQLRALLFQGPQRLLQGFGEVPPMAMASPTDFMVVVSVGSAAGNFSKANRGTFTTT